MRVSAVILKEHFGLRFLNYLVEVATSLAAAILTRFILEPAVKHRSIKDLFLNCSYMHFYQSGRSVLAAVFEKLIQRYPGAMVLVPNYIYNIVYQATAANGLGLVSYRTDETSPLEPDDLTRKVQTNDVVAVLLASLLDCKNRSPEITHWIRSITPDLFLVVGDTNSTLAGAWRPQESEDKTGLALAHTYWRDYDSTTPDEYTRCTGE